MNITLRNCCLCGFELKHYSKSADPVAEGRCCNACFYREVIPARRAKIQAWKAEESAGNTSFEVLKDKSECVTRKICYKKKEDAEYALYMTGRTRELGVANRREKIVYFCKLCNNFHLSSHDKLPSWRDRNLKNNFDLSKPAKYVPVARQENWENDAGI